MKIALVGNQNCGKTTLFNYLTGSNQHVGNFPGVTVEGKMGFLKDYPDCSICDLPGIYSLSPYSNEEIVTRDYIINEKPDIVLNIVDATNIERNIYLTLQLCELNVPVIMALNMMDEVVNSGNSINVRILSECLGIKVCPITASKGDGVSDLLKSLMTVAKNKTLPKVNDFCKETSPVHRAIHAMMELVSDHAMAKGLPIRYVATHVIEGDELIENSLDLSDNEKDIIDHVTYEMTHDVGFDREACIISMRYEFIDHIASKCVHRVNLQTKEQIRSNKIDKVLTNKYFAFPIFILIMGLIFYLTFSLIGGNIQIMLDNLFGYAIEALRSALTNYGLNTVVISLVCDGVFTGVSSVLSFLPLVVILFFFLSLLEDTGYMARIAFIMDKPLRKLGLSGRSFVPLLIGFGCSVPSVMATRTLTSRRDQRLTLMLIPFMPCTAKLPILTLLTAAFFGAKSPFVMIGIYLFSIIMGVVASLIIRLITGGKPSPFMMELPAYRMPSFTNTIMLMWEKAKDFLKKAFTIIFLASIVIWFLQSFDRFLNYVGNDNSSSLLASISKGILPLFKPLGIKNWEICASIITGLSAKEAVVTTLEILLPNVSLLSIMTVSQCLSLLVFVILYMPCIATFSVMRRELKSTLSAIGVMAFQTGFAYLISFLTYSILSIWL